MLWLQQKLLEWSSTSFFEGTDLRSHLHNEICFYPPPVWSSDHRSGPHQKKSLPFDHAEEQNVKEP